MMSLGFQCAQPVKMTSPGGMEATHTHLGNVSGQLLPTGSTPDAATCHMNLNHNHMLNRPQAFQHKPMAKSLEGMQKKMWHALTEKTQSNERR